MQLIILSAVVGICFAPLPITVNNYPDNNDSNNNKIHWEIGVFKSIMESINKCIFRELCYHFKSVTYLNF